MFWERFYELCISKGTKPNPVAKEIGISSGTLTKWKKEGILPNGETLKDIANYLNCSVDYLLGRTDVSTPEQGEALTPDEAEYLQKYRELDDTGKEKAGEYLADLAKLYSKMETDNLVLLHNNDGSVTFLDRSGETE